MQKGLQILECCRPTYSSRSNRCGTVSRYVAQNNPHILSTEANFVPGINIVRTEKQLGTALSALKHKTCSPCCLESPFTGSQISTVSSYGCQDLF